MKGKKWSNEEIDYLIEMYGRFKLPTIAKKLRRSVYAVEVKAYRIGLGGSLDAQDSVSKEQIRSVCNVTTYMVNKWINTYGLKSIKKVTSKEKAFCLIKIDDFWDFAFKNNEIIDFSKIEKNILGLEPDWVDTFRKRDFKKKVSLHGKKWTKSEVEEAKRLFKKGLSYKEIAVRINRSYNGVRTKLERLGYKTKTSLPWREEEIVILKDMVKKGYIDALIGEEIGRPRISIYTKRKKLIADGVILNDIKSGERG